MYYRYGGSFIGTMTETNRYVRAYREGKIPFVVNQSIWMEGEARFADIVLPACTNFERWDIGDWAHASGYGMHKFEQVNHRLIVLEQKCIEPLGESKSDYEIFAALAGKLGVGDIYTEGGLTELDWVKRIFDASDLPARITWDEFAEKGYYLVPVPETTTRPRRRCAGSPRTASATPRTGARRRGTPWAARACRRRPARSSSSAPASSASTSPATWWTRSARSWARSTSRAGRATTRRSSPARYPLQLISPHPRFSFHTMGDGKDAWAADIEDHRELKDDGWYYWLIRLNPEDAAARGIADGDLVRAFNDRGSVILCARVTEQIRPGTTALRGVVLRLRAHRRARALARPRRLRQHPDVQALHHPHLARAGVQHLPHRGGAPGSG